MEHRLILWLTIWGVSLLYPLAVRGSDSVELVLYNWANYMPPELLDAFQKETGVQVRELYYSSDESKQALLAETQGVGLDLIISAGASMREYVIPEWIDALQPELLPHLSNVDSHWMEKFGEVEGFGVPLLWGTIGIAYRSDKLPQPPSSWQDFFKPHHTLRQKIMVIDDSADAFGMALVALGYSMNSTDLAQVEAAGMLLEQQKPYVAGYAYPLIDENSELIKGHIVMAMMYNGDAVGLHELDPRVEFVAPAEGANLWVDYIGVVKKSQHKEEAHQFIDFLLRPENAAKLSESLHYASANKAAASKLSKEHLENPDIYPPKDVMDKVDTYKVISPEVLKLRNQMFRSIKR
ncbi:Spermidine/putrescine-binding periplasmic protein [Hahella chejuensis KCTC 2396]|uniref:Putrescine-binding periplasmic protein n=2 Tax=Hahella chejuensis TaxID=158327 RepID=Q2SK86_HAHCH|nr:Spermidine/putrescine-binding periplasmic protein [Hahella chejuensis KCTC 2396]